MGASINVDVLLIQNGSISVVRISTKEFEALDRHVYVPNVRLLIGFCVSTVSWTGVPIVKMLKLDVDATVSGLMYPSARLGTFAASQNKSE